MFTTARLIKAVAYTVGEKRAYRGEIGDDEELLTRYGYNIDDIAVDGGLPKNEDVLGVYVNNEKLNIEFK